MASAHATIKVPTSMRVVISLGGNALVGLGEPADIPTQRRNATATAAAIADVAREHDVVLTHGNGPQIGSLALQNAGSAGVNPAPLDVLGAESEGMIGYVLALALRNALPTAEVLTVLAQVLVDADDPALERPTKPVGRSYTFDEAERARRPATAGPSPPTGCGSAGWCALPNRARCSRRKPCGGSSSRAC